MKIAVLTVCLVIVAATSTGFAGHPPWTSHSPRDEIRPVFATETPDGPESGVELIIRTDDHGHRMPFDLGPATSMPDRLPKGAHVSVTYRPLGPTGQAAVEVQVIERGAEARSQASFKVVSGPADIQVSAR